MTVADLDQSICWSISAAFISNMQYRSNFEKNTNLGRMFETIQYVVVKVRINWCSLTHSKDSIQDIKYLYYYYLKQKIFYFKDLEAWYDEIEKLQSFLNKRIEFFVALQCNANVPQFCSIWINPDIGEVFPRREGGKGTERKSWRWGKVKGKRWDGRKGKGEMGKRLKVKGDMRERGKGKKGKGGNGD